MLHSKKSQSILQWYNSLTLKGNVNTLEQFTDGSLFYDILPFSQSKQLQESKEGDLSAEPVIFSETSIACNEEVITSVEDEISERKMETPVSENVNADPFMIKESDHSEIQKKYHAIQKYIDDTYHVQSSLLIDYGECQKGKELELAKVAVFLLSALVQNLLCLDDDMVKNTTLLDMEVQENIKECMSLVLVEDQIKKSELNKVLSRAASYKVGTPLRKQPSRNTPDTNDLSEGVKNVPKKRRERAFASEDIQHSPIERLLDSPKIQDRVYILRKEELRKLRNALDYEETQVMELRMDKKNLNQELEKRKKELNFYKKELESLREVLGEKEEQEKLRVEELKDKKNELEKYKKVIENLEEEMKLLRTNNEALEEKVAEIEKKLKQDATACVVNENNNLKEKIQLLDIDSEKKDEIIKALEEKIKCLQSEVKLMNQEIPVSSTRKEITRSPNVSETLSNIIYADKQSREKLERKEHELRQDRDVKDERIKRLTRMGETTKNKNTNVESLQNMVDHLLEENTNLKEKLESYESQSGSTSLGASVAINLNSVKKENDGIGPAEMDGASEPFFPSKNHSKKDELCASISDNSFQNASLIETAFNKDIISKIISSLAEKNFLDEQLASALKDECSKIKDGCTFSVFLQDFKAILQKEVPPTKPSMITRSGSNNLHDEKISPKNSKVRNVNSEKSNQNKDLEDLKHSNADLRAELVKKMEEAEKLKQDVAIFQEKYINMEKLAKKKDEDVKKALLMYQKIAKLKKKENDAEKKCGEECEKLRRRCKKLNEECLDFEQETAELKRSVKNLEGMMEHLQFEIKELNKEKKELKLKLWEETSALSKNTTERDALVLHYLKKSKHEPKKIIELKKEEPKKSSRPILKVDAYIMNSEIEPSTSNSVLASRSIRSSFFQVADEDDFLNESSLAEIHHGGMLEGESAENRLQELQRRNTLCPPHLQSSYPLEIQNMTPSERKYYCPEDVSFDTSRKSSQHNGKRDIPSKPKARYAESDSDDSDDALSFPVKKRKISEVERISVPVSKQYYQGPISKRPSVSVARRPSKDHEDSRKPTTPMKRAAAYMKKKAAFITPSSVNRLMKLPRKSKLH